jgi:hypothetical protein
MITVIDLDKCIEHADNELLAARDAGTIDEMTGDSLDGLLMIKRDELDEIISSLSKKMNQFGRLVSNEAKKLEKEFKDKSVDRLGNINFGITGTFNKEVMLTQAERVVILVNMMGGDNYIKNLLQFAACMLDDASEGNMSTLDTANSLEKNPRVTDAWIMNLAASEYRYKKQKEDPMAMLQKLMAAKGN